ncbi:hypothetical protein JHD47_05100 [Sulfurimonas sp. SAG-AH-194-L11]|nr:hypothetical protein [Sulfurimonas sp. SAG-AH-194-L11]MDF1877188.1 hypothetical protein [Sulfurimonas sp. SAG-AH-194-L11]
MKTITLICTVLLVTCTLSAQDSSSYEVKFSNAKVNYIDVPKLNLQLKHKKKSSFEFIFAYANSLFSNTKKQDRDKKQHNLRLALNYKF